MLGHNSLQSYYHMMFLLVQHHKYSITELENLIPYERDIYFEMLANFLKELEERRRQAHG